MKTFTRLMFAILAAVALVSCASAPKTEPAANASVAKPADFAQVKKTADDARTKALDIKANVAAKSLFDEAEAAYNAAKDSEKADVPKATSGYQSAAEIFTKAYDDAAAKKDAAAKAMTTAADERKTAEEALSKAADEQNGSKGK